MGPGLDVAYREAATIFTIEQELCEINESHATLGGDGRVGAVPAIGKLVIGRLALFMTVGVAIGTTIPLLVTVDDCRLVAVPKFHHLGPVVTRQVFPLFQLVLAEYDSPALATDDVDLNNEVGGRPWNAGNLSAHPCCSLGSLDDSVSGLDAPAQFGSARANLPTAEAEVLVSNTGVYRESHLGGDSLVVDVEGVGVLSNRDLCFPLGGSRKTDDNGDLLELWQVLCVHVGRRSTILKHCIYGKACNFGHSVGGSWSQWWLEEYELLSDLEERMRPWMITYIGENLCRLDR